MSSPTCPWANMSSDIESPSASIASGSTILKGSSIYNTLGQRVNRVSRNGIFIHNGKKVLIRNRINTYNMR